MNAQAWLISTTALPWHSYLCAKLLVHSNRWCVPAVAPYTTRGYMTIHATQGRVTHQSSTCHTSRAQPDTKAAFARQFNNRLPIPCERYEGVMYKSCEEYENTQATPQSHALSPITHFQIQYSSLPRGIRVVTERHPHNLTTDCGLRQHHVEARPACAHTHTCLIGTAVSR